MSEEALADADRSLELDPSKENIKVPCFQYLLNSFLCTFV